MTTRTNFHNAMQHLKEEIAVMSTLVATAIAKAIEALVERDLTLAHELIDADKLINNKQSDIEDLCVLLIAREQPVAGDLRKIITALKIVTQLERMGDHAAHIAKAAIRLSDEKYIKPLIDIPEMGKIGIEMLESAIEAYLENDSDKAEKTALIDDKIDNLHEQVLRELLTYMMEDPRNIRQANNFLFISRFLERIGDHVTNICECVVFSTTGRHTDLN